jgi:hypothetical protein
MGIHWVFVVTGMDGEGGEAFVLVGHIIETVEGVECLNEPLNPCGAPGESTTESGEYNIVTLLHPVLVIPDAEWNGGSSGIAVSLDVHQYFFV